MARIHDRYDPAFGPGVVDLLERLQVFHVFTLVVVQRRAGRARSSRSSSARSTGRRGCGASRPTSGSSSRTVLRPDAAGPRGVDRHRPRTRSASVSAGTASACARPTADGLALPLRRPPPVHEARDAVHPPRADPVPRRRGGDQPPRRRAAPRGRRRRLADGPADRHARPADRQELRLRGARARRRQAPTSRPTWRSTRTASEIARKTIQVNDPLSVAGFTFHQNGFGPAPDHRRSATPTERCCGTGRCR